MKRIKSTIIKLSTLSSLPLIVATQTSCNKTTDEFQKCDYEVKSYVENSAIYIDSGIKGRTSGRWAIENLSEDKMTCWISPWSGPELVGKDIYIPRWININNKKYETVGLRGSISEALTGKIVLPNSFESIGDSALCGSMLTEVLIPPSVKAIYNDAFNGSYLLTNINLNQVIYLDEDSFDGCTKLETIDFGKVQVISQNAFSGCTSLKELDLKHVIDIGRYAFGGCTSLTSINLKDAYYVEEGAFEYCSNLEKVDLGNTCYIEDGVFSGCTNLHSIKLNNIINLSQTAFMLSQNEPLPINTIYVDGETDPTIDPRFYADISYLNDNEGTIHRGKNSSNDAKWVQELGLTKWTITE